MTKTAQVTPEWRTGIYVGNGVVATPQAYEPTDDMVDAVLDQIVEDVNNGDLTAIEELMRAVAVNLPDHFDAFLPEADYDPSVDH